MRWWQTVMMAVGSVGAGLMVTGPSYAADTTVTTPQQDEYNSIVAANRGLRRDSSMFHPSGTMRLNIDGGNDNLFGIGVAGTADDNGQIRLAFTPEAQDPSPSGISSHILTSLDYDPRPGDSANDGSVLHFVGRTTATGNDESRTVSATAHVHVFNRNGNFASDYVSRSDRINGAVLLHYRMLNSAYKWYTLDNNGVRLDFSFDDGQTYLLPFYIGDIDGHESWSVSHAQLMWLRGTNVSGSTDTAHWTGNVHYQQHDHQVEILGHDFAGGSSTPDNAYGTSYRNSIAGSASGMIYGSSFSIGVEHAGNQPMNEWIGKQNGAGPLRADIGGFGKIGVTPPSMVQVQPEKIVVSEDDKQRQIVKNDDKYRNDPQKASTDPRHAFETKRFDFTNLTTWRVPDAEAETGIKTGKKAYSLEQHNGKNQKPLQAHAGEHVTWILHTGQRFTNGGQFHSYTFTDQLPAGLAGHDSNFDANQHRDIQASDVYLVNTNMTSGGPISLGDGRYGQVSLAKQGDGSVKLTVKLTAMGLALINKQSAASRNAADTYDDWSIAVRTVVWPGQDDTTKLTPGSNNVMRMDNVYTVSGRDGIIGKTPDPESNHSLVELHSDPLPSNDLSIKTAAKKMNFRRNIMDLQGQVQYLDQVVLPERDQAIFHRYQAFSLVTSPVDNDHGFDGGEYNDLNHYRPVLLVGADHHEVALTSSEYSWGSDKKLHLSLNENDHSQALAAINQAMKADSEAGRTVQIVLAGKDLSHDSAWWKALQDTSTWHNPGGLELSHKANIGKHEYHLQTDVQGDFMSWHAKKTSTDLHNHIQVVGKDPRVHIKVVNEHDQGDKKVVTYRLFANQGNDKDTTKPWSYELKVGDNSLGYLFSGSGGVNEGVPGPANEVYNVGNAADFNKHNGESLIGLFNNLSISHNLDIGSDVDYWVPDRFVNKKHENVDGNYDTIVNQYLLHPSYGLTNPKPTSSASAYSPKIEYYRAFDFVVHYDKNALYGGAITKDGRLPLTVELHTPASSRSYDESGNNSYYSSHEFVSQSTASVAVPHQTLDLDTLVEQDDYNWQKNLSKSHYEKLTQWDDDGQGGLKTLIKLTPDNYWNSSAFNKAHNLHDGDQSYTVRVNIPHGFDGHMKAGLVSAENLAINNYSSLSNATIHHDSWGDYAEVKVPVTNAKAKYVVVQANPKTKHWKTYRQFNHTMQTTVDINQVKADGISYGGHIATDGDYENLNGQAVTVTGKALTEPTDRINTTGDPQANYTDSLQSPVVIGSGHGSWDSWQNSVLDKAPHTEMVKQASLPGDTSAKIQLPNIYQLQVLSATAAYRGENQWDQVPYLTTYSRMAALSVDDAHPTDFSRLGTNRIFGGAQRNSTEQAYAKTWGDLISIKDARSTHLTTNQTGQVMTMYSNNGQLAGTDHDDPTQRLHLATGNRYHRGDAIVLMGNPDSEAYSAPKTGRGDKWSMSSLDIKLPMNPISTRTLDHLGDNNQFNSVTTANLNTENQQYQTKQYYDHLVLSATDRGRLQAKAGYGMVDTTQLLVDRYDLHDPVTKQADLKTNATSDYYAPGQRRVAASVGDQIKPDRQATIFTKDGDSQRLAQDTATTQRLGLNATTQWLVPKTDSGKKSFFNLSLGNSLDGWKPGDRQRFDEGEDDNGGIRISMFTIFTVGIRPSGYQGNYQRFDQAGDGSRVVMALRNVARDQGNGAKTAFTDTQNGNLNLSGYGSVRLSNALTISNVDKWAQRLFTKHGNNTYVNMDYTKRVVDADTPSSDQIDQQVQTAMDDQDHFKAPVTTKDKDLPATSVDGTLEGLDDTKTDQAHYQDHGTSDQAATPHRSLTTLSYRYPSMQLPDQVLNHNTANEQPETFGFLLGFGSKLTDGDTTRVAKNMPADRYNDNGHYLYLRNDLSTGEYRLHYQSDHFGLAGATKIDLWRPVEIYGHRYLTKGEGQDDNDNDELNLQPVQSGKHKTDLKQSFDKHLSQKEWDELDHFLSNNTPSDK